MTPGVYISEKDISILQSRPVVISFGGDTTTTTTTTTTTGTPLLQGVLFAWGGRDVPDSFDNLGVTPQDSANITSPTQVGSDNTWVDVQPQISSTVGLKSDGTLWGWGENIVEFSPSPIVGVLGLGTETSGSDTPVQIGSGNTWTAIAVGERHFIALRADGTIWGTGYNSISNVGGQLGLGDNINRSTLTQIGSDTDWVKIFAGPKGSMAIKSNGTLWATGENSNGQLGIGTEDDVNVFTQVGTDTDWDMVSMSYEYTMAIKTTGTLWAAGADYLTAEMGLGAPTFAGNIPSFTQVGSDTNWNFVDVGDSHTFAIKTTGTLWGTGYNGEGQLGLGDTDDRNTFTQIGSDTWEYADAANYASFAIKTDGTLWSTGYQNDSTGPLGGRLGLGDYVDRDTFTQVGASTNWIGVRAGNSFITYSVFGIRTV